MIGFSLLNPLRFGFGDEYLFDHNYPYCYYQKWQQGDRINIQILSDSPVHIDLRDHQTGRIIQTFDALMVSSSLQEQDFQVWEFSLSDLQPGSYFLELYADNLVSRFKSNPFIWSEQTYNTVLFYYRNSFNDFDAIFETGLEYYFRVEGTVQNFSPKQDNVIYFNQRKNPELLSATPYRAWSLIVGLGKGIPDWVLELFNYILAVDTKKVDGLWFNQDEGSEVEVQRIDNYPLSSARIDIVQRFPEGLGGFHSDRIVLADSDSYVLQVNGTLISQKDAI